MNIHKGLNFNKGSPRASCLLFTLFKSSKLERKRMKAHIAYFTCLCSENLITISDIRDVY